MRWQGPARAAVRHAGVLAATGFSRFARWERLEGRGFPDPPPPCSGEARKTRTGWDVAPPQYWRRVGCPGYGAVGLGLLGASGLARPAQPLAGWRRRVPRPARPRCRLRGRSLGTRQREIPGRTGGPASRDRENEPRQRQAVREEHRTGKGAEPPACSPETTGAGSPWPGAPPWRWSSNAAASDSACSVTRPR